MSKPITVRILGDTTALERSLNQASGKLESWGSKLSGMGRQMTVGLTLPIAAAGLTMVNAASDLAESTSMVDQVFTNNAQTIKDWAKSAADNMGMTQAQALQTAGSLGAWFQSMGFDENLATDWAQGLTGLSADLASFYNMSTADASAAMRSILAGESEVARRLGVDISEARLKALAAERGWQGELTETQKLQLRHAALYADTAKAQGDYARTSDGYANTMRTLQARLGDAAATLGTKLLPVVEKVTTFVGDLMDRFSALDPKTQNIILVVLGLAAALGPLLLLLGGMATGLSVVAGVLGFLVSPIGLVIAAVAALVAGLVWLYHNNETFREGVQRVWEWISTNVVSVIREVIGGIQAMVAAFQDGGNDVTSSGFAGVLERVGIIARDVVDWIVANWPKVQAAIVGAFTWIQDNVVPVVQEVSSFIITTVGGLIDWWKEIWPQVSEAVGHVFAVIQMVVGWIVNVITFAWNFIAALTDGWGDNIARVIQIAWTFIQDIIGAVVSYIQSMIQTFLAVINGDWSRAWEGLKGMVAAAWSVVTSIITAAVGLIQNTLGGAWDTIGNILAGAWGFIQNTVANAWNWIVSFIRGGVSNLVGQVMAIPSMLLGLVGSFASAAAGLGRSIIDGIGNGIRGAVGFVGDIVGALWSGIKSMVNSQIIDRMNSLIPDSLGFGPLSLDIPDNPIPRLAMGGFMGASGWATVGERGPETVWLPKGAKVSPSHEGSPGGSIFVNVQSNADPVTIGRELAWALRTSGR